jgi:hypothetical protein
VDTTCSSNLGVKNGAISCWTKAVLAALVVLFPVVSVTTVIFPPASLLATLFAVAVGDVSSLVTYLLVLSGVQLVPARASYFQSVELRTVGVLPGSAVLTFTFHPTILVASATVPVAKVVQVVPL